MIYVLFFFGMIFTPIGIYFYKFFKKLLKKLKIDMNDIFFKFLLITICVAIVLSCCNPYKVGVVIFGHFFFFCILSDLIVFFISKALKKRKANKLKSFHEYGIIPICLTILFFLCAYHNAIDVEKKEYTIYSDKPLSQEYSGVLITDLHFGTTLDADSLNKYVNEISAINPDFVILAGDIIDEYTTNNEMYQAFFTLGRINSKYGVFFVYGNHDKSLYNVSSTKEYSVSELESVIKSSNITMLVDESYTINNELTLIGRDDLSFPKKDERKTPEELLVGLDKENYLLLIDHHPQGLEENSSYEYDLQLSGHTHGGQIFPTGLFNELLKLNELNYGYKKINDLDVIVTSGMGGWAYPFRSGTNSEYVVINIKNRG